MSLFFWKFDQYKCKTQLMASVQRIKLSVTKKTAFVQKAKKDIASLLQENKDEKAKIRVEAIIREDFNIEALEIVELICELLGQRLNLIVNSESCPEDLYESVSTLIWAADRLEIAELQEVKNQFQKKYGNEFIEDAMQDKKRPNGRNTVDPRVKNKLSAEPPSVIIVNGYLSEIALSFGIDYKPNDDVEDIFSSQNPSYFSNQMPIIPGQSYPITSQQNTNSLPGQGLVNQIPSQQDGSTRPSADKCK